MQVKRTKTSIEADNLKEKQGIGAHPRIFRHVPLQSEAKDP